MKHVPSLYALQVCIVENLCQLFSVFDLVSALEKKEEKIVSVIFVTCDIIVYKTLAQSCYVFVTKDLFGTILCFSVPSNKIGKTEKSCIFVEIRKRLCHSHKYDASIEDNCIHSRPQRKDKYKLPNMFIDGNL
jgi:hypothetical protein